MSHLNTQRQIFAIIDHRRRGTQLTVPARGPHGFNDWRIFFEALNRLGIARKHLSAWIVYHTTTGQTRRDLFTALNAALGPSVTTFREARRIALDNVKRVATVTTTSGRNEA